MVLWDFYVDFRKHLNTKPNVICLYTTTIKPSVWKYGKSLFVMEYRSNLVRYYKSSTNYIMFFLKIRVWCFSINAQKYPPVHCLYIKHAMTMVSIYHVFRYQSYGQQIILDYALFIYTMMSSNQHHKWCFWNSLWWYFHIFFTVESTLNIAKYYGV